MSYTFSIAPIRTGKPRTICDRQPLGYLRDSTHCSRIWSQLLILRLYWLKTCWNHPLSWDPDEASEPLYQYSWKVFSSRSHGCLREWHTCSLPHFRLLWQVDHSWLCCVDHLCSWFRQYPLKFLKTITEQVLYCLRLPFRCSSKLLYSLFQNFACSCSILMKLSNLAKVS